MKTYTKKLCLLVFVTFLLCGCQEQIRPDDPHKQTEKRMESLRERARMQSLSGDEVLLSINIMTVSAEEYSKFDGLWRYINQNLVTKKRPDVFMESGFKMGLAMNGFAKEFERVRKKVSGFNDNEGMPILKNEKHSVGFTIGPNICLPRFIYLDELYTEYDHDFTNVKKQFNIYAKKLSGNMVELVLAPSLTFANQKDSILQGEIHTKVKINVGQSLVIAMSSELENTLSEIMLSHRDGDHVKRVMIIVTPYLQ